VRIQLCNHEVTQTVKHFRR